MATALRSARHRTGTPERQLARIFRRELAPQLGALDAERSERRGRFIAIAIGAACGVPLLVYALWPLGPSWAVAVGVIGAAIALNLLARQQRAFRDRLRALVMPAVCRAIGDLQHSVGVAPQIPFGELQRCGLLPQHDRCDLDDVFAGRHRGVAFVLAEARLRRRRRGHRGSRWQRVFRGLIGAVELPRESATPILITRERGAIGNRLSGWLKGFSGLERVTLRHPAFEARFEAYAERAEAAGASLSPGVCDALVALAEAHGDDAIRDAFLGRRLYLAIAAPGDQFRLGSLFRPLAGLEQEAMRLLDDVRVVHRVIDRLGPQSA